MKTNKTALATSLAAAFAVATMGTAMASTTQAYNPYSFTGSNFSMVTPGGASLAGGTNDVSGSWDGTLNNSVTGAVTNMTLASPTPFSGFKWTASNVEAFGAGTYTFTETNGHTQKMVVGAGQVGVHMLFAWNTSSRIGVVDVYNLNNTYTGPFKVCNSTQISAGTCGVDTADSWSNNNNHIWGLASTGGQGMVNGPFGGFKANFNLYNGANVTPVPLPANAWLFGTGLLGLVGIARRKKSWHRFS